MDNHFDGLMLSLHCKGVAIQVGVEMFRCMTVNSSLLIFTYLVLACQSGNGFVIL